MQQLNPALSNHEVTDIILITIMIIPTFEFEEKLHAEGYKCIAGIDEAGRGAWAGPIVGAAVILPLNLCYDDLPVRDSKTLSANQRNKLFKTIKTLALGYQITIIDNNFIDTHGITMANSRVVSDSANNLTPTPDYLLIDHIRVNFNHNTPFNLIIKGDSSVLSIAAASVLTKVTRDRLMQEFATTYPKYGFEKHVGYGTKYHKNMLEKHGPCEIHRKSYKPIKKLLISNNVIPA